MGADAEDVAFVGDDVDEFVLAEEAFDGGEGLGFLFAGFDGDGEVAAVGEAEADDAVGDAGGAPVAEGEVDGLELVEVVGAVFPTGGVVGVGGVVVEVADVVEEERVAIDLDGGELRDVGEPVAGVGGLDGEVAEEDEGEGGEEEEGNVAAGFGEEEAGDHGEEKEGGEDGAGRGAVEVGVGDGEGGPEGGDGEEDCEEGEGGGAQKAAEEAAGFEGCGCGLGHAGPLFGGRFFEWGVG